MYLLTLNEQEIITPQESEMQKVFVKLSASCAGLVQFRFTSLDLTFALIISVHC
jgi:hypothetical protein